MNLVNRRCDLFINDEIDRVTVVEGDTTYTSTTAIEKKVSKLRVTFRCEYTLSKDPNTAEIVVYNLSEDSRGKFTKKFAAVRLDAGYGPEDENNKLGTLFTGDIQHATHERKGSDWVTTLHLGDGSRKQQFACGRLSYGNNTPHTTVIRALADHLSLNKGNLEAAIASTEFTSPAATFRRGYSMEGPYYKSLAELMASHGFGTSIQGGALKFVPRFKRRSFYDELGVPLLTPDTGLIGSPAIGAPDVRDGKPAKLKARCLLNTKIRCGSTVEIQSKYLSGVYVVERLVHTGDTQGAEWYTDIEGVPLE